MPLPERLDLGIRGELASPRLRETLLDAAMVSLSSESGPARVSMDQISISAVSSWSAVDNLRTSAMARSRSLVIA
jgi:hypothetical protein